MRSLAISSIVLAFLSATLAADHPPDWLVSKRSTAPDVLKIRLGTTSIKTTINRFGEPLSRRDLKDFPGEAKYLWEFQGLRIRATTMFPPHHRTASNEMVYALEITSSSDMTRPLTSDGVRLGDDLEALVSTYGWRYLTDWRRPERSESKTITFIFRDDSEVSASFSDAGKLVRLFVRASIE